ncbi:MAG: zinc metallopeptidase [Clostridia bacterium]|nr:zinc metallopeptidase [Clostridia bacterium]MBQ5612608.1 zinc metallopeptidase [Clostridia bacterium]MBQ5662770.1 zinc metallopeptidase [Clostridia bacterium]
MLFGWFYYDWTVLILLPGMLFAFWAQMKVSSTFDRYSKKVSRTGRTGAEAASQLLRANGVYDVRVERVRGDLTDHYDPRTRTLRLSESVHDSRSIAAIGVACHEAGHALQHAEKYSFLQLRMSMIPVCRIGSGLAMPLFLIGLLIGELGYVFMVAGILCFSLAALFQLITLPVEFNASARALAGMQENRLLGEEEIGGARRVLSAAAMTYVAALASSLLSLLRLVVIANNRRR